MSGPASRWSICLLGIALQVCLGTAYAWSYFQKPLGDAFGWSNSLTAWAFCLAICSLGLSAAWGGMNLARFGPRRLAMAGGALFGSGYLVAALALTLHSPVLLILGYGVIGGCGLGLGYVTPVATVAKWFPDRKGLATGLVVMGFGLGALAMSKLFAPMLYAFFTSGLDLSVDGRLQQQTVLAHLFAALGVIFLFLTVTIGWFLRNPPEGYAPPGWSPPADAHLTASTALTARACICSRRFALMWLVFFCNTTAGIAIIGFQSPLFQDLWRTVDGSLDVPTLAAYGATLIGITSLFNGLGRFVWGGLSDRIGRPRTFSLMLGTQVLAFAALAWTGSPWIFAALSCWILLCYGGGFGTMPSFILDVFGARLMPVVYGTILTAWSAAGIVGPQMVALIKDACPAQAGHYSFLAGAAFVLVGFLASFRLSNEPLLEITSVH
jgi:MFS transporter, OFA family, oxalate/formate antiporter